MEICDPCTLEHDDKTVTNLSVGKKVYKAMENADCVAFLAGHDEFHKIPISDIAKRVKSRALIFDGRMFFSREKIVEMKRLGLLYKGVGRR